MRHCRSRRGRRRVTSDNTNATVYEPREIKFGPRAGSWNFTESSRGRTKPIGYCGLGSHDHANAGEVLDCFRRYLVDNVAFYAEAKNAAASPCLYRDCRKATSGYAKAGVFDYRVPLCDHHRNPTSLQAALADHGLTASQNEPPAASSGEGAASASAPPPRSHGAESSAPLPDVTT